jgi:hypothetical protein
MAEARPAWVASKGTALRPRPSGSDPNVRPGSKARGTDGKMIDYPDTVLSEQDLVQIERAHPDGLTSAQIIAIFQARGARLSEATFRKYVQLGLLPRSRRVGLKGKHRGSHGLYPCATVRRINSIKRMMSESFTIEEIQRAFVRFKRQIEQIEAAFDELFKGFEREIGAPRFDQSLKRNLSRDLDLAKRSASDLVRRMIQIETQISWSQKDRGIPTAAPMTHTSQSGSHRV